MTSPVSPPDNPFREGQERDLKAALKGTDPSIPLVFVSGNHDLGNTPTPRTVEQYCSAWGNDYFSFWVSRHRIHLVVVEVAVAWVWLCFLFFAVTLLLLKGRSGYSTEYFQKFGVLTRDRLKKEQLGLKQESPDL